MADAAIVADGRRRRRNLFVVSQALPFCSPLCLSLFLLFLLASAAFSRTSALQFCEADDIDGIYGHCWESVQPKAPPVPPSRLCCMFIGDAEKLPCVCRFLVTKEVERSISIPKLAVVARKCGVPLMPGTKCGSYVATAPAPGDDLS